VTLVGAQDPQLNRGLWLVKWFLAISHFVVLALLWLVFVVLTVVAFFAILVSFSAGALSFMVTVPPGPQGQPGETLRTPSLPAYVARFHAGHETTRQDFAVMVFVAGVVRNPPMGPAADDLALQARRTWQWLEPPVRRRSGEGR
jgi:hypothetical protein